MANKILINKDFDAAKWWLTHFTDENDQFTTKMDHTTKGEALNIQPIQVVLSTEQESTENEQ